MIDLYTAATGNGRRVSVMLEECGLRYTVHKIDLAKGDQRAPAFLEINPQGTIPAIVDGEGPGGQRITMGQSSAILVYLAEKTGRFLPAAGPKRARALQWLFAAATDAAPASGAVGQMTNAVPEKIPANTEHFEARLVRALKVFDKQLAGAEFLAGELSIADFALYPVVSQRKAFLDRDGGMPNLKRWEAAMAARPGVQRGMQVPA